MVKFELLGLKQCGVENYNRYQRIYPLDQDWYRCNSMLTPYQLALAFLQIDLKKDPVRNFISSVIELSNLTQEEQLDFFQSLKTQKYLANQFGLCEKPYEMIFETRLITFLISKIENYILNALRKGLLRFYIIDENLEAMPKWGYKTTFWQHKILIELIEIVNWIESELKLDPDFPLQLDSKVVNYIKQHARLDKNDADCDFIDKPTLLDILKNNKDALFTYFSYLLNKISPNEKIYLRVAHEAFCYCVNILNEKKTESGQSTINKEGNTPKTGFFLFHSKIKIRKIKLRA